MAEISLTTGGWNESQMEFKYGGGSEMEGTSRNGWTMEQCIEKKLKPWDNNILGKNGPIKDLKF